VLAAGGSDVCLGQIDVRDVDPEARAAALGIWIAPAHRRRGLGSAALALAGRWLIAEGGLQRLQLLADPADPAIRAAALRAGFRSEGIVPGGLAPSGRRGAPRDAEVFALVSG
jgi:RimJ/RimL family protein N-acetyltransferase